MFSDTAFISGVGGSETGLVLSRHYLGQINAVALKALKALPPRPVICGHYTGGEGAGVLSAH
jgi:hypothetical protein